MPWVQYDALGAICGVCANQQRGACVEQFLAADDAAVVAYLNPVRDALDTWDSITLRIAFAHENRIRALEGKAPITLSQFRNAVKALL